MILQALYEYYQRKSADPESGIPPEGFEWKGIPFIIVIDRDGKFGHEVTRTLKGMGIKIVTTAYRSPWQNGVAERWVLSVRQDLLNNVIVLGERHLSRLLNSYVRYYQEDRCHLGLAKDCPVRRRVTTPLDSKARIIAFPRVGGLHHRYVREAA